MHIHSKSKLIQKIKSPTSQLIELVGLMHELQF